MAYGTIKVDTVTFTNDGVDKSVTLSGLVQNPTFSGNVTVTGTLSGVTVTGTTANFTSGNFTNISGGTHTITSGVFAAGSAASPSITFTGDLNTGIYSPGTDQVAISTGGTGRLFVNSSGSVGIGNSSPSYTLDVTGTHRNSGIYFNQNDTPQGTAGTITRHSVVGLTTRGITGSVFDWSVYSAGGTALITNGTGTNNVTFPGGNVAFTGGSVGIGTTAPIAKLVVSNAGANGIEFYPESQVNTNTIVSYNRSTSLYRTLRFESSDYYFTNGTTTFAHIDSSGRLLVNTSTSYDSNSKLEIQNGHIRLHENNNAAGAGYEINWSANGGATGRLTAAIRGVQQTTGTSGGRLEFSTTADGASSPTERMRIDSSGRVGIGTTNPNQPLEVNGFIRGGSYQFRDSGTGIAEYVGFSNSNGPTVEFYGSATGLAGALLVKTAGSERARIDSSGRLLVGTSSSRNLSTGASGTGQRLQVETAGSSSVFTTASIYTNSDVADLGAYLELGRSKGTSLGSTTIVASGDRLGEIRFAGTDGSSQAVNAASIAALVDGTPGTNDMPGRLVFSTTADGASSPTERMRITSDGELLVGGTNDNGAYNIQCNGTGIWGFGAYVNGSDERLKENINPIASSLNVVKSLNPVTFQYKEEFTKDHSIQPGFIAQELQQALADQTYLEGVVQTGPQYLSVAYQSLIPVLTKALQEAIAKIETLEAKVAALESA